MIKRTNSKEQKKIIKEMQRKVKELEDKQKNVLFGEKENKYLKIIEEIEAQL